MLFSKLLKLNICETYFARQIVVFNRQYKKAKSYVLTVHHVTEI